MGEFEEIQPVSGVAIAFLVYFYVVVATFHEQLKSDEKKDVATADIIGSTAVPTNKVTANGGDHCLIALDGVEDNVAGGQGCSQKNIHEYRYILGETPCIHNCNHTYFYTREISRYLHVQILY